jgi:hypothetical protein
MSLHVEELLDLKRDIRELPTYEELKVHKEGLKIPPVVELGSEAVGTEISPNQKE